MNGMRKISNVILYQLVFPKAPYQGMNIYCVIHWWLYLATLLVVKPVVQIKYRNIVWLLMYVIRINNKYYEGEILIYEIDQFNYFIM